MRVRARDVALDRVRARVGAVRAGLRAWAGVAAVQDLGGEPVRGAALRGLGREQRLLRDRPRRRTAQPGLARHRRGRLRQGLGLAELPALRERRAAVEAREVRIHRVAVRAQVRVRGAQDPAGGPGLAIGVAQDRAVQRGDAAAQPVEPDPRRGGPRRRHVLGLDAGQGLEHRELVGQIVEARVGDRVLRGARLGRGRLVALVEHPADRAGPRAADPLAGRGLVELAQRGVEHPPRARPIVGEDRRGRGPQPGLEARVLIGRAGHRVGEQRLGARELAGVLRDLAGQHRPPRRRGVVERVADARQHATRVREQRRAHQPARGQQIDRDPTRRQRRAQAVERVAQQVLAARGGQARVPALDHTPGLLGAGRREQVGHRVDHQQERRAVAIAQLGHADLGGVRVRRRERVGLDPGEQRVPDEIVHDQRVAAFEQEPLAQVAEGAIERRLGGPGPPQQLDRRRRLRDRRQEQHLPRRRVSSVSESPSAPGSGAARTSARWMWNGLPWVARIAAGDGRGTWSRSARAAARSSASAGASGPRVVTTGGGEAAGSASSRRDATISRLACTRRDR